MRRVGDLSRFRVLGASENSQAAASVALVDVHDDQAIMGQSWDMITRSGRPVTFRSLRAEDEELFKSFIRSCRLFLSPRRREDRCPQP